MPEPDASVRDGAALALAVRHLGKGRLFYLAEEAVRCNNPGMQKSLFYALIALAPVVVLTLSGCRKTDPVPPPAVVGPAPPIVNKLGPVTEEEAQAFGRNLEAAIVNGDSVSADRLYRIPELMERSISDIDMPQSARAGALEGIRTSSGRGVAAEFVNLVRQGGQFKVLRVRMKNERWWVVVRLMGENGAIAYQEIILQRHADGKVASEDVYVMAAGEMLSQNFRRMILQLSAELPPKNQTKPDGKDRVFWDHIKAIKGISAARRSGNHQEVVRFFNELPAELQKEKSLLVVAITAAAFTSEKDQMRIVEIFRQHYPNDPALDLISFDHFRLQKQFDQCIQAIDRIDKVVGGDPYLAAFRASARADAGQYREAKWEVEKAIDIEPSIVRGYETRTLISLREKNYADTLVWLKRQVENCDVVFEEPRMREISEYAQFFLVSYSYCTKISC